MTLDEIIKFETLMRFKNLQNNVTHTAKSLGVSVRYIRMKLREYGIPPQIREKKKVKRRYQ